MKLKNATQLAVIGVILQLVPSIMYFMADLYLLPYWHILGILDIIGIALLLPFFITLFKSQK
ncbi:MAG: hypothetical protein KBA43_06550 [Paludibacteraceae bacterium]|nr:hypothetical protein [Paludibacteraceae bacterium]